MKSQSRILFISLLVGTVLILLMFKERRLKFTRTDLDAENQWTDITDVIVPRGHKYDETEGIVYNCLSGIVHSRLGKINTTRPFHINPNANGQNNENDTNREEIFQEIFDNQFWVAKPYKIQEKNKMAPEFAASGPGSRLEHVQRPLLVLNALIERLKVNLDKSVITMLDVPCGDFRWMRELIGQRADVQYTGIDIVPTLIEKHRINFKHLTNTKFEHQDIVKTRLTESYDIIFCREMLQHLVDEDVMKVLDHFSSSGSKLLVTTQYEPNRPIDKISNGGYRNLNLMLSPFNLQPPMCLVREAPENWTNKLVAVWKLPLKQTS